MSYLRISMICTLLIVGLPAIAEEPSAQQQINGKCTLTKRVDDHSELVAQGDIVAIPKGVGHVFHMEEFMGPEEPPSQLAVNGADSLGLRAKFWVRLICDCTRSVLVSEERSRE